MLDNVEIQRIIRDCFEQLYGSKMDNLGEMDRFLEKFNLPRLNQVEIMNNPITSTEIEAVIKKNLPKIKSSGPDGFTREIYQTFREELMSIILKLSQKIAEERTFQLILQGHYHPDTKTKDNTKRENHRPI